METVLTFSSRLSWDPSVLQVEVKKVGAQTCVSSFQVDTGDLERATGRCQGCVRQLPNLQGGLQPACRGMLS